MFGGFKRSIISNSRVKTLFCCSVVLLISYFTYFKDYDKPLLAFYDEHYYIIHAERYIHRIVFFDGNPPLGKMFIALGEIIFNPNKNLDVKGQLERGAVFFNTTVAEFSFVGVRFFPALFGLLNGLLIFLIFYGLSKNHFLSLIFSSLYLFENSSIVHFRGAMLDSTLVFFSFLTILYFIYLYEKKKKKTLINYFILGCLTSLAVSTKTVGMILVLLFLFLSFKGLKEYEHNGIGNKVKKLFKESMSYLSGLIIIFFSIYYIHVVLGSNIILKPLLSDVNVQVMEYDITNKSDLGASKEYIKMIKDKEIYNPLKFYIPMKNHFRHIKAVQSQLPTVDPFLINSQPIGWPIGIKNINYLFFANFPEIDKFGYLKFQGNPVNWTLGLLAVLLSICLIFAKIIFKIRVSNTKTYNYVFIFASLYIGYMIALILLAMGRVLYIHMYFLPLFFSFILFFLMFNYIFEKYIIKKDKILYVSIFLLVIQIFYVYLYTSPITYGKPITYIECEKTRLINFWEDTCRRQIVK